MRERHLAYRRQWHKEHKDRLNAESTAYREGNLERMRELSRVWNRKHRPHLREYESRRRQDPMERLNSAMANRMYAALKRRAGSKAGQHWETLAGYTVEALRVRLEAQFKPGMSWANYGKWHVDHVRPVASFRFVAPTDPAFRECWALSNLQPLWAADNHVKGDRLYPEPNHKAAT